MAINVYRAQVSIPQDTGLAEDSCVNTWHFKGLTNVRTATTDGNNIVSRLTAFYQAIDGVIFPPEIGANATIKVYNLSDLAPRVPIVTGSIALTPTAGASMPKECALALSYQAVPTSGIPQARRRGRIFLGPLTDGVRLNTGGGVYIDNVTLAAVGAAATTLQTNTTSDDCPWSVYSPTNATFEGDIAAAYPATEGWLDNAFDTIRSRGTRATSRTTWT